MFAVLIYVCAIAAANLSIAAFGPWVSPINALILIGLDLALRDKLHDRWRGPLLWPRMAALIVAAGVASYLLNPAAGRIAVASMIAFVASGIADAVTYHALRGQSWPRRSNGSNVSGAAVDSLLFPAIAFGAWMPGIVAAQMAAKVVGGAAWTWVLRK